MKDEMIYELVSIKRNSEITLSATLLFSPYPQAYFPQLCITAIVVPGTELGKPEWQENVYWIIRE